MSSFEDRKKNFENKFAHDEELKFKVNDDDSHPNSLI